MTSLVPSSKTNNPRDILLGGATALAQSAWMGFALASSVLDQIWTGAGGYRPPPQGASVSRCRKISACAVLRSPRWSISDVRRSTSSSSAVSSLPLPATSPTRHWWHTPLPCPSTSPPKW